MHDSLGHVAVGLDGADEGRLQLLHAGVGEQQGGVVQRDGGRRVKVDVLKKEPSC